jgi:hypothetical protein
VVTFVPNGDAATRVKLARAKPLPAWRKGNAYPARLDGIVVPVAGSHGEYLSYVDVTTLEAFSREDPHRVGDEPVESGDYVRFTVMSSDKLVWELDLRGRRK